MKIFRLRWLLGQSLFEMFHEFIKLLTRHMNQCVNDRGLLQAKEAAGGKYKGLAPRDRLAKRSRSKEHIGILGWSIHYLVTKLAKAFEQAINHLFEHGRHGARHKRNLDTPQPGMCGVCYLESFLRNLHEKPRFGT